MISERQVADGFHSFWSELFPLLTPNYVRLFNATYPKLITRRRRRAIRPLPLRKQVRHNDIVSEVAFSLVQQCIEARVDISAGLAEVPFRHRAQKRAQRLLSGVHKDDRNAFDLTLAEWNEVSEIAQRYDLFFTINGIDRSIIEFEPAIRGVGFVQDCHADFSVGSVLFEVKTVDRGIQSRDIRQLILYLALQAATGDRRWSSAGFLNPRRGLVYRFEVESIVYEISGGKSGVEIFADVIDFLTTRDVEIERPF